MASLQARHQRDCAIVVASAEKKQREGKEGNPDQWSTFSDAAKPQKKVRGKTYCTCTPMYYVVLRQNKRLVREPVGHNRKEAQRALDARRGDVARREYRVLRDVPFAEWADGWLASATVKANSKRVYRQTLEPAKRAFGRMKVRELEPGDVRRFLDLLRAEYRDRQKPKPGEKPREVSDATLAKHLRQLGACLQAAVIERYATENPVRLLSKTQRPRPEKPEPVYFTDAELARLWPELAYRPVMLALCKIAVLTGARFGELAALRWGGDVNLLARELRIARTFVDGDADAGFGEQDSTKSGKPRKVDLTPQAAAVLEAWYAESGGDGLVFSREEPGRHLTSGYVLKSVLYPALERAGIPREGEHGRERDFHSFRHTFARIALENGAEMTWVQKQLGHSSITLTVDTYGHWERSAEKAQAERLAGAFPV